MSGPMRAIEESQSPNLIDCFENASKRASWDDFKKEHLVKLLCSYRCPWRKKNRWSPENWVEITNKMKEKFPECSFSMKQLKQLERDIKKKHKLMKDLKKYGLKFDKEKFMLVASNEEWQQLFKIDPKAKKWQGKVFPYYADLDVLYGVEGAASENNQALNGNADCSSQPHPTCVTTITNGDVDQTSGFPTSHQNSEEEIYGRLPPLTPEYCSPPQDLNQLPCPEVSTSRPPPSVDGYEQSQNQGIQNQGFVPINSQHRASSSHVSTDIVGANPGVLDCSGSNHYLSYCQCLTEYDTLPGFDGSDVYHATKIFYDSQNCEVFLSFNRANRAAWLRLMIDGRKQQG